MQVINVNGFTSGGGDNNNFVVKRAGADEETVQTDQALSNQAVRTQAILRNRLVAQILRRLSEDSHKKSLWLLGVF